MIRKEFNKMKIEYIRLKNAKNIESGQHVQNFEVDLSGQTNPVCIINGPNGSGKTSLLSYLTPFASLGNLDIRDGSIIIDKKEGEKEIHIKDGEDTYIIRHFYTPKKDKGHTVKSYIECNGVELNENGNVTSFKEIVYKKLELDMDYLKLIRIGDNVSNLIDAKSTERKTYMGKILAIVDIYLKQHKQLGLKLRDTKTLINHMMDELQKTGVKDAEEFRDQIQELKDQVILEERQHESYAKELAVAKAKLDDIGFTKESEFELRKLQKKNEKFEKALASIPKGEQSSDLFKEKLEDTKIKVAEKDVELKMEMEHYNETLNTIDDYLNQIDNLKIEIKKETDKIDQSSTKSLVGTLRETVERLHQNSFDRINLTCTKEDFETVMVFYKSMQLKLQDVYQYGQSVVSESMDLIIKQKDVMKYASNCIAQIEAEENKKKAMILDKLIQKYKTATVDCKKACPLKVLHAELLSYEQDKSIQAKHSKEFYQDMKLVAQSLKYIIDEIVGNGKLLDPLPKKVQEELSIVKVMERIKETELIYPEKLINNYLSEITEYSLWKTKKEELIKAEAQLEQMETMSKAPFYKKELEKLTEKKSNAEELRIKQQQKIIELKSAISLLNDNIENYQTTFDALTENESLKEEITKLEEANITAVACIAKINETKELIEGSTKRLLIMRPRVTLMEENLNRYHTLLHELDEAQRRRDEIELIQYGLSNKTGVPLYHIKNYLNGTRKLANELLDIVYDGRIRLDEFEITDEIFAMPYIKEGKRIDDVVSASQGERSFFNMAISSALRAQGLTKYNIALFDEPDGPFDDTNRQKFIPVLEKQLELNRIEQAFLITHNQMFSKYPVDVIDMGNLENSTIDVMAY